MSKPAASKAPPDWEQVLSSAARLQRLLPDAVLVGGTAAGIHAGHRASRDADHILTDLRPRFDDILEQLESVAGWTTARVNRPVRARKCHRFPAAGTDPTAFAALNAARVLDVPTGTPARPDSPSPCATSHLRTLASRIGDISGPILGRLDGIETGVRQLIRAEPLETMTVSVGNQEIRIPTEAEILRIKGFLLLRRNATRDYVDFAALADRGGDAATGAAFERFDRLYPQDNGESALQQMLVQLSNPKPYDLDGTSLSEYNNLESRWHDWNEVRDVCAHAAAIIFDHRCALDEPPAPSA